MVFANKQFPVLFSFLPCYFNKHVTLKLKRGQFLKHPGKVVDHDKYQQPAKVCFAFS